MSGVADMKFQKPRGCCDARLPAPILPSFMGTVGSRVTMASCGEPLGRGLLASTWVFLVLAATGEALREHVVNLCCQRRCHITPEFLLFTLILLDQAALVGLGHVFATLASDLMD